MMDTTRTSRLLSFAVLWLFLLSGCGAATLPEQESDTPPAVEAILQTIQKTEDRSVYIIQEYHWKTGFASCGRRAGGFEQVPEVKQLYTIPEDAASTPEEAVDLLFRAFMDSMGEETEERAFAVVEILETNCRLLSREDIEAFWAAGERYDWGYAYTEDPSPRVRLEENQWLTFCDAVIRYEGFLFYGYDWPDLGLGSDELRWGRLSLEDGQWVFAPTEDILYELGLVGE